VPVRLFASSESAETFFFCQHGTDLRLRHETLKQLVQLQDGGLFFFTTDSGTRRRPYSTRDHWAAFGHDWC